MPEYPATEPAERAAAILTAAGMPRMPARVMMALVAAPDDGYTAADLADRLGVSAAAISGAVRYLQQVHFIQRRSVPGDRRERFFLLTGSFVRSTTQNSAVYERSAVELEQIAAAVDPDTEAHTRAHEIAEFFRFLQRRMPQLVEEWEAGRR